MINSVLWELAQAIAAAIPGKVRNHKCGKEVAASTIVMAIYNCLEKEDLSFLAIRARAFKSQAQENIISGHHLL